MLHWNLRAITYDRRVPSEGPVLFVFFRTATRTSAGGLVDTSPALLSLTVSFNFFLFLFYLLSFSFLIYPPLICLCVCLYLSFPFLASLLLFFPFLRFPVYIYLPVILSIRLFLFLSLSRCDCLKVLPDLYPAVWLIDLLHLISPMCHRLEAKLQVAETKKRF